MPRPAITGSYWLDTLGARVTAGARDTVRDALAELVRAGRTLAVDIETFGLGADARRIKCVAVADQRQAVVLDPRDPGQAHLIRCVMDAARTLVFHNSQFDVPTLSGYSAGGGRLFEPQWLHKVHDTLIYARLAWPDTLARKDLESLAHRLLSLDKGETIKIAFRRLGLSLREGFHSVDIDSPMFLLGCATDALVTARLYERVRTEALATLTRAHPFVTYGVTGAEARALVEREQHINRSALRRTITGLAVDLEYLDSYRQTTATQLRQHETALSEAGVRPGNANDLVRALDALGAIPADHPRTPKTGRASTRAADLEKIRHPLAQTFTAHKQIIKVQDDYLAKVTDLAIPDSHGVMRVHPTVNLLKATTGRASISDPPLHQFSAPARGIILADPGDHMTSIDWSQIEPVTAAYVAGDRRALAGYESGQSDLYSTLAELAHVPRKTAKVVLLAQMYGEGIGKLAADLNIAVDDAYALRQAVFSAMPDVTRLLYKLRDIGAEHRKVFTLSGRILDIPMGRGFDGGPPTVATHKAVNYFVQGSAYDVLAEAWVRVIDAGLDRAVYLTMHDEIVCSTDAAHDIEQIMRTPPERLRMLAGREPVLRTDRADLGQRWATA